MHEQIKITILQLKRFALCRRKIATRLFFSRICQKQVSYSGTHYILRLYFPIQAAAMHIHEWLTEADKNGA